MKSIIFEVSKYHGAHMSNPDQRLKQNSAAELKQVK
jgi:hypothetical protein